MMTAGMLVVVFALSVAINPAPTWGMIRLQLVQAALIGIVAIRTLAILAPRARLSAAKSARRAATNLPP